MKTKKTENFQTIGLIGRSKLENHKKFLREILKYLKKRKCRVIWDQRLSVVYGEKNEAKRPKIMKDSDLVITLGGDGTILKAVRKLPKKENLYLFGINLGNVGFHTEVKKSENVFKILDEIFNGEYHVDERFLLRACVYRGDKKIATHPALNDIAINQGNFARLICLKGKANGKKMINFKADGMIVSTPSGSTGHSLSAGGPIVHPQVDGLIFTPICPTDLSIRPVVMPDYHEISITIDTERRFRDNKIGLTVDGQIVIPVEYGDEIRIRKSERKLKFLRRKNSVGRYYRVLRNKLHWGERS